MVKQAKDSAAVLWGCLCMVGNHPPSPLLSFRFLTQTMPLNTLYPEKGTPCLQHLPCLILFWVVLCAVFQGQGRMGCLKKLNLRPEVFLFCFVLLFFLFCKIYKWIWIIKKQQFKTTCPKEACLATSQHYKKSLQQRQCSWMKSWADMTKHLNQLATTLKNSISKWVRQILGWIFGLALSLSLVCGDAGILLKQENLLKISADSLNKCFSQASGNLSMNWTEEHLHMFCCPFPQCTTGLLLPFFLTINPSSIHDCRWKNVSNKNALQLFLVSQVCNKSE